MCELCNRIELIKQHKEPYFIKEYETGYLSLFDNQAYPGYCLYILKEHKEEIFELEYHQRQKYFNELSYIIKKINDIYKPLKMNYCFLGNGQNSRHLHCHIIPNNTPNKTIWHGNCYHENFDYDIEEVISIMRRNLCEI